jgi:hypothetical protein
MERKLIELNFKSDGRGIYYLSDAVKMKKDDKLIPYCKIYKTIADKYNTTLYAVERCIRHCVTNSKNEYCKDTVSGVISKLAILL